MFVNHSPSIFAISHPVLAVNLSYRAYFFILYLEYLDKRYTYNYEAIVAHGIPEALKKDMALVIKAKAHFDYFANNDVVLKVARYFYSVLSSGFCLSVNDESFRRIIRHVFFVATQAFCKPRKRSEPQFLLYFCHLAGRH